MEKGAIIILMALSAILIAGSVDVSVLSQAALGAGSASSAADTEGTASTGAGYFWHLGSGSASSARKGSSGSAGGSVAICEAEGFLMVAVGGGCSGSSPK